MNIDFWKNKRVFITGHTGFKGSWISFWLNELGAKVYGYALEPPTQPSLFNILSLDSSINHILGDIRDFEKLKKCLSEFSPDIVMHMAAQPLVRYSYQYPIETYNTNVMGTVHLLEAALSCDTVKVVLNVTTDKCYENREWIWGYRESEAMGGFDPYSSSKGCSELVTAAYRKSFYNARRIALASARAGNVIGGGDWSDDRLVPDIIRAIINAVPIEIRYPQAIRPWQHVLEPLAGYLLLIQKSWDEPERFSEGWNFGPEQSDTWLVKDVVDFLLKRWGDVACDVKAQQTELHEANYLRLDTTKAQHNLNWHPKLSLHESLNLTVDWYKNWNNGDDMIKITRQQISTYQGLLDNRASKLQETAYA